MNEFIEILNDALRIATFQPRFSENPHLDRTRWNARIDTCEGDDYLRSSRKQVAFASTRPREES